MKISQLFSWEESPIKDWVWQRVSAVIFLIYALIVMGYWYLNPNVSFLAWRDFILSTPLRVLGSLALFSLVMHAWIGLWTVISDYVKGKLLSKVLITVIVILLLLYFGIGLFLLWGI